jgi:aspartate kinase
MKFGGTSVEDAAAIRRISGIIGAHKNRRPIVVLSACAGVTDQLLAAAELAATGQREKATQLITAIADRHKAIAQDLFASGQRGDLITDIDRCREELSVLVTGVAILGELTPRSLDAFASYGERLSTLVLHTFFAVSGLRSRLVDARSFMITDDHFTKAAPQFDLVHQRLTEVIPPALHDHDVVVTQGFIGATAGGIPTTIGRGGSDYSAAIIGALLDAEDIQIWTDVDGILTADPTIVSGARRIKVMSFNEAAELAYFGARVLHPETILPAVRKNIPVHVLNSRRPESPGTMITASPAIDRRCIVKSIAYKEGITLISIVSTRMFLAHGFLENVFDVFHKYRTVLHTVATSEVSISVTIDNRTHLDSIVRELQAFATVTVSDQKAIICVVGENLKTTPGVAARVLHAVAEVNINMISQGASEINISFVIDEHDIEPVVHNLHREFFANPAAFPEVFE